MTRRGVVGSGLIVVVVYLLALGATVIVRHAHVRPLYDGIAPPPTYSWVNPPAFFASGNVRPAAANAAVPIGPTGSRAAGIATPDGQFVIDLDAGALAPHGTDREVEIAVTPTDPKRLARIPLGLRANGNAYRVVMTYEPSGAAVTAVAKQGSLLIEIPELGDRVFTSPSGRVWATLASRVVPPRDLSLSGAFTGPGYYVAATNLPELEGPVSGSSHHSIAIGLVVAVLAILLLTAVAVRRARRNPRT